MRNLRLMLLLLCSLTMGVVTAQRGGIPQPDSSPAGSSTIATEGKNTFDIFMSSNKIGSYEAQKIQNGNTTEYSANSESSVRLFGKHTITVSMACTFQDGMLINSEMFSHKNGKLRDHTSIVWKGNGYEIIKNGDSSREADPIKNMNIQLYFEEPQDNMITFSEKEAIYKRIKKTGANKYVLAEFGEDSGNTFAYSNDVLQRVDVSFILGDFSIIRN